MPSLVDVTVGAGDEFAHDRRIVIYPSYINANSSLPKGRKVSREFCVEHPTLPEILEVLKHLGFEASAEDKTYPRDPFQRGRVRVALKDPHTGEPVNPEIPTRRRLLEKVGAAIPNLKTRIEAAKAAKPSAAEKEAAELQAMALGLPPGMPVRMIQQIAAQAGVGDLIPGASQEVAKQPACGGGGGGGGGSKKKKKK